MLPITLELKQDTEKTFGKSTEWGRKLSLIKLRKLSLKIGMEQEFVKSMPKETLLSVLLKQWGESDNATNNCHATAAPALFSPSVIQAPTESAKTTVIPPPIAVQTQPASAATAATAPAPRISGRDRVIHEIIETERKYVESLRRTCTEYLEPLQADGTIITPDIIATIFGNINILLGLNETLYSHLCKSGVKGNIGRVFITFAPLLKMYTAYLNHSELALKTYATEKEKNGKFAAFCSTHAEQLDSLLIKPVQRLPRYQLLLEELVKRSADTDEYLDDIKKGLAMVIQSTAHCNDHITLTQTIAANHKMHGRFKDIEGLPPCLNRKLLKEAPLLKYDQKGNGKETMFYLFSDAIAFGPPTLLGIPVLSSRVTISQVLNIADCSAKAESQARFMFSSNSTSFLVQAESQEDQQEWVAAINSARENLPHNADDAQNEAANDTATTAGKKGRSRSMAVSAGHAIVKRNRGSVTVEVVKGHSMPKMDLIGRSDCYAYVKWLTENADASPPLGGVVLRTSTHYNSLDPVWHDKMSFPFIPADSDVLHLEVLDEDRISNDDLIGMASVEYSVLKRSGTIDLPLVMATKSRGKGDATITIKMVESVHDKSNTDATVSTYL